MSRDCAEVAIGCPPVRPRRGAGSRVCPWPQRGTCGRWLSLQQIHGDAALSSCACAVELDGSRDDLKDPVTNIERRHASLPSDRDTESGVSFDVAWVACGT